MDFELTIRDGKCLDVARAGSLSPLKVFFGYGVFLASHSLYGPGNKGVRGGGYNVYESLRVIKVFMRRGND